jgi:hypothetical protein
MQTINHIILYYQHAIQYFLNDVNSYYKVREVANGILHAIHQRRKKNKNPNIRNSKSDKIEDREKTLRKYFCNLVSWGILLERETNTEKGIGSTFEYKLTRFGNMIALLIETGLAKNKHSHDMLYTLLASYFNEESYSLDIFCKIYLRRIKEKSLFYIFIDYLRKNIIYENRCIDNENDLFTFMVLFRTLDNKLNKKLWKLWKDSFNELYQEVQPLFLYHLKLKIDSIIDETVSNYGYYEDALFGQKEGLTQW